MRKFNFLVVAAWLAIFFFSLFQSSGIDYYSLSETHGLFGLGARINTSINEFCWSNIHWATVPEEEVIVKTATIDGKAVYESQEEYNNLVDNRMTQTILRNTFIPLLLLVMALNIAFYAGKGTYGRWGGVLHEKVWRQQILFRYLLWRAERAGKKANKAQSSGPDKTFGAMLGDLFRGRSASGRMDPRNITG